MKKKVKFAKGKDKIDGWEIDYEQLESVQLECEKRGEIIGLEEAESVILSLVSMGYLNTEEEE
jgi:hypothetical protein